MMKKGVVLAVLGLGGLVLGAADSEAQVAVGAEALFGSETDFGLGGRVVTQLSPTVPLDFQGGFVLFFPDGPVDYWEINGNIWYTIETPDRGSPYVGGGLNIGRVSGVGDASETDLGVNLGGGYRFDFTNTAPFIEARFTIGNTDQFVIGGGVMLGSF